MLKNGVYYKWEIVFYHLKMVYQLSLSGVTAPGLLGNGI